MRVLVTGGAGFIGSALVRTLIQNTDSEVCTVDNLAYSGSLLNLQPVLEDPNHRFEQVDICDADTLGAVVDDFEPDGILHLAAESHVDRSIDGGEPFVMTNVHGTYVMLEAARKLAARKPVRFVHVSTDEVYGSLGPTGKFSETSPYQPNSPYSATKAGSDHLARAWFETYGLPVIVTNCSNNYGPYQFPEKLIPLVTLSALSGSEIPVYGDGRQVRDWLFVDDHVEALMTVMDKGAPGETYLIGGNSERTNLQIVQAILDAVAELTDADRDALQGLIMHVQDRPGHDRRYAIDASKLRRELEWEPKQKFEDGIRRTVAWYIENQAWCDEVGKVYAGERLGRIANQS